MSARTFLLQLLFIAAIAASASFALHQWSELSPYRGLSWISITGFVTFSLLLFFMGQKSSQSVNNQLFVQLFLIATVVKMFLCVLLIWLYFRAYEPSSHLFIIPFFCIYFLFTFFEVHFLGKLAKGK